MAPVRVFWLVLFCLFDISLASYASGWEIVSFYYMYKIEVRATSKNTNYQRRIAPRLNCPDNFDGLCNFREFVQHVITNAGYYNPPNSHNTESPNNDLAKRFNSASGYGGNDYILQIDRRLICDGLNANGGWGDIPTRMSQLWTAIPGKGPTNSDSYLSDYNTLRNFVGKIREVRSLEQEIALLRRMYQRLVNGQVVDEVRSKQKAVEFLRAQVFDRPATRQVAIAKGRQAAAVDAFITNVINDWQANDNEHRIHRNIVAGWETFRGIAC